MQEREMTKSFVINGDEKNYEVERERKYSNGRIARTALTNPLNMISPKIMEATSRLVNTPANAIRLNSRLSSGILTLLLLNTRIPHVLLMKC